MFIASCTYLRACINGSLRMSPVGGALWREIGQGGLTVDSISVPAGVDADTSTYSPTITRTTSMSRSDTGLVGGLQLTSGPRRAVELLVKGHVTGSKTGPVL
ncbi:hypothetical protein M426DRAFT_19016 [Hypoxylon sp. CI-4A]|nr:hypothetical protein M426DRAFT_19016 [Hypoxylon sp. CI-4A]